MEMLAEGESADPVRPQTPQPPFPYVSREVTYTNDADGTRLAGTLTVPEGAGPFPAALLITGSGPQNRDEEIFGHKPFWVIADHLSRNGIAVLRADDRGVGDSLGDMATATTEDFAGDALAGVRFLAAQRGIDAGAIGLIGHSEGGIIAPMVATRSDDVAFIVLLAGTGVPGVDLMVMQLEATQRSIGRSEENIARQAVVQRRLLERAAAGADLPEITETVAELTRIQVSTVPEAQRPTAEQLEPGIEAQAAQLMAPWFRFFLNFDPRSALRNVRVPTLAMNGSLDTQVPARVNLEEIESALEVAGNTDITVQELDGLNHLFQTAETGSPTEYATIEETFSPTALRLITDWILARVGPA
jgi:pimeloyl-ACP methyl ester carboxylesterase